MCGLRDTLNTTRICGGDHFKSAIEMCNIVYADKSPGAIVIANGELIQDAMIASPMIHFPNNAPILYSYTDYVDFKTVEQILKLKPDGVNGVQIFLVGGLAPTVRQQLLSLGFSIEIISGENYFETAANVARYRDYPQNIMIVSSESYWEGLSACAWSAHMGDPILFTTKYELPSYTRDVILETRNPNIYLVGSYNAISEEVEKEIGSLNINYLDRISGNDPYEVSVNFSKYKSRDREFGWGKTNRNGHAFTFAAIESPFDSASGAVFAHLGKHSPTLVVNTNEFPDITRDYIESVKPVPQKEPNPPFMHGWIIGCENDITFQTQIEIEKALSIDTTYM